MGAMDEPTRKYIDHIDPEYRPLFDRLHQLIVAAYPGASVGLSYSIPTYTVGKRHLYVGVWKHGVSVYGWHPGSENGFIARHLSLKKSKGTIQLRPADATGVTDDELLELVHAALRA
jgi:uncharacterized protein YdhG (YjbR/CyaY superfamily)